MTKNRRDLHHKRKDIACPLNSSFVPRTPGSHRSVDLPRPSFGHVMHRLKRRGVSDTSFWSSNLVRCPSSPPFRCTCTGSSARDKSALECVATIFSAYKRNLPLTTVFGSKFAKNRSFNILTRPLLFLQELNHDKRVKYSKNRTPKRHLQFKELKRPC